MSQTSDITKARHLRHREGTQHSFKDQVNERKTRGVSLLLPFYGNKLLSLIAENIFPIFFIFRRKTNISFRLMNYHLNEGY